MRKYAGMCSFYRGMVCNKVIEAERESDLLRLASKIANKEPSKRDILYVDYVNVAEDMSESVPLPQQCYARLLGCNWEYQGEVPEKLRVKIEGGVYQWVNTF